MTTANPMTELTVRGVLLGGAITLLFTAANVYLGLKVGLTFATSIPAAVISMAILRNFRSSTILENNIVQTVASAAGTLASIVFVLPGLVMIGWWQGFPYFVTAGICATGGVLGVMFSVPLRRALVTGSDLPYPEGRAAAEVLKVGAESRAGGEESRIGLITITFNTLVSAGFALLTRLQLAAGTAGHFFRVGGGATGVSGDLSFALIGAGHLVGLSVGLALLTGLSLGWFVVLPILTAAHPLPGSAEDWASAVFRQDVRFFGAGVIAVAAIWTLIRIARPVLGGMGSALAASRARRSGAEVAVEEQDLPIGIVTAISAAMLVPIAILLDYGLRGGALQGSGALLVAGALLFIVVLGVALAAVCGYMAGVIGSSNSPVSGLGILSVIAATLLLVGLFGRDHPPAMTQALAAYALIVTGIVIGIATIANDNLQDLRTGQLVGATPWKQQVALVCGVVFGSLVIPPVLDLLNTAFGFAGVAGARPTALAAPQAALISALATGVIGGDLNWTMIGLGALAGGAAVLLDLVQEKRGAMRLPPLAIGIGVYLPMGATLPVVIGACLGHFFDRWADRRTRNPDVAKRIGVLAATGLIVGDGLFNVAFAGIVAGTGADAPLAVVGDDFPGLTVGVAVFALLLAAIYGHARRNARRVAG